MILLFELLYTLIYHLQTYVPLIFYYRGIHLFIRKEGESILLKVKHPNVPLLVHKI